MREFEIATWWLKEVHVICSHDYDISLISLICLWKWSLGNLRLRLWYFEANDTGRMHIYISPRMKYSAVESTLSSVYSSYYNDVMQVMTSHDGGYMKGWRHQATEARGNDICVFFRVRNGCEYFLASVFWKRGFIAFLLSFLGQRGTSGEAPRSQYVVQLPLPCEGWKLVRLASANMVRSTVSSLASWYYIWGLIFARLLQPHYTLE